LLPKVDNRALWVYVPYSAWLGYATYLNAGSEFPFCFKIGLYVDGRALTTLAAGKKQSGGRTGER
jgi:hypothetical protein